MPASNERSGLHRTRWPAADAAVRASLLLWLGATLAGGLSGCAGVVGPKPQQHSAAPPYPVRCVPILLYHEVGDDGPPNRARVSTGAFRAQMEYLRTHGYQVIRLDQVIAYLDGRTRLGTRPIAITFDDGYLDVYYNAIPILRQYHYPAAVFVTVHRPIQLPAPVQQIPRMSVRQWRELAESGFTIGSHGLTHPILTTLSNSEALREIRQSKTELERLLGRPVSFFAYPKGKYNMQIVNLVRQAGYTAALATGPGVNLPGTSRWALRRLTVFGTLSLKQFARRLELAVGTAVNVDKGGGSVHPFGQARESRNVLPRPPVRPVVTR